MTRNDFERIYRENASIVEGFLYIRCRDRLLTEELTQETFCRALAGIETFDGSCKISVWLCAIAKRVLYKHYETHRETGLPDEEPPDPQTPDELAIGKEHARHLLGAVDALPPMMRQIVMMRTDGVRFSEIAKRLGIREGTARVAFHRAKGLLKKEERLWK